MIRLKHILTEQQQEPSQLMLQRRAIMQDALTKLEAIEAVTDADAAETIKSVDNAVCRAYIEYCDNMRSHMRTEPDAPLYDLSWGPEIINMIARIKQDVTY